MRLHPQLNLSVENNYLLPMIVVFFLDCIKETLLVNIKRILGSQRNQSPSANMSLFLPNALIHNLCNSCINYITKGSLYSLKIISHIRFNLFTSESFFYKKVSSFL